MRLLLADDHSLVRDALKVFIEREEDGITVTTASGFHEALALVHEGSGWDLIILDYRMPGMDGLNGLVRMLGAAAGVPVAIISGMAGRAEVHQMIARGAAGFLPKTLPGTALIGAIRLMLAGEKFLPASTFDPAATAQALAPAGLKGQPATEPVPLTLREREVLTYLNQGKSNKEIARALDLKEVTVKLHIRGLCRKLNARNRTQAVLNALALGLAG